MKILISFAAYLLLSACFATVDTPGATVRGDGYEVRIGDDHHHGYHRDHRHGHKRHCPPGHAKKGWC